MRQQQECSEQIKKATRLLRLLGHPARLTIIRLLEGGEALPVGEIQRQLGITQSMTSQHLAALRQAGIVKDEKVANVRYYRLENRAVLPLLQCLQGCCGSL